MASHISVQGEQSTSIEVTTLTNLAALDISASGEFIRKTGTSTFENATLSEIISLDGLSNVSLTNPTDGQILAYNGSVWINSSAGSGTVTSVSVVTANGVSGTVATATTTPAITLTLGAITPSAVNVSGLTISEIVGTDASKNLVSLAVATYPSLAELAFVKGVSSAIQTQMDLKAPLASPTFTGTVTIPTPFTIGAVSMTATGTELNYVVGVSSAIQTQLNAKQATISFGTGVETALGVNVGSVGAVLVNGGVLGTPSSGTGTNITGIPAASILAGSFGAGAYVISTSLQVATIELGHATDTTIARVSAGVVSIEGNNIYVAGGTDVAVADGGTGASTAGGAASNLGLGTEDSPQFAGGTLIQSGNAFSATTSDFIVENTNTGGNASLQLEQSGNADRLVYIRARGTNASGTLKEMGRVDFVWLDRTAASEDSEFVINLAEAGTETTRSMSIGGRNLIVGSATTGFSTIASTRAALTIAGTTSAGVLEFGPKTATVSEAILREIGYNGATAVYSLQVDSNVGTNNTGSANFFVNNGAGLISGFKIASDGGIFLANLLAAAASTDVNIDGSNELHSVTSSKRFKTNITNVKQNTSKIYDLKVKEYDFKKEFGGQHEVGIIAEEAEEVLPQLVVKDLDGNPYSFQYSRLSVFLLAEIQKLNERIKQLENK